MGYLKVVCVLLLVQVISNRDFVSSIELVDSSSSEEIAANQGQFDSPTPAKSEDTPTVVIIEKPQHDVENNTLNNQRQVQNETKYPSEFFPFTKVVLKPVFHIKRIAKINKNEVPRFVAYNQVPNLFDISGRKTPPRPLIHRSIFITKLTNPKDYPLPRPHHYMARFDPTLGLLDRMMNDLMVPLLNDMPLLDNSNHRLDTREDSSLKGWMQNERNKPNQWNKRENPVEANDDNVSSEDVGNNEEESDYKTDLWKKYMTDDKSKQDSSVNDHDTSDCKRNTCHDCISCENSAEPCDGTINDENNVKEDETEWWSRLVLPWKRPIYKDHKKSSHQETRMSSGNAENLEDLLADDDEKDTNTKSRADTGLNTDTGFNTRAVGLRGNVEFALHNDKRMNLTKRVYKIVEGDSHTPIRGKRVQRNVNFDAIILLFSFGIMVMLLYKLIRLMFKTHLMARINRSPESKPRVPLPSYAPPPCYYTHPSPEAVPVPSL
ncbi:hypothetical protein WDU94_015016 [Cyamophila willieti]